MKSRVSRAAWLCIPILLALPFDGFARSGREPVYSPYAGRDHPTRVYWGDTHLHTALSSDAGAFGNRLGPDAAYRFARGEEVVSTSGQPAKLSRPLDFIVIADHSDGMGFFPMLLAGDPMLMEKEEGRRWHRMIGEGQGKEAAHEIIDLFAQGRFPWETNAPELMGPVWEKVALAADRYDDPGTFTAFIGYEWTSLVEGNNLHRVVIYRDGASKALQTLPYTNADSSDPEDLWRALARYEEVSGGRVLAIPHNGNLSNGLMFAETTLDGRPIDRAYARTRSRWEPLCEVTQIKGDGETHPLLSPDDEFADFETWDVGNLDLSAAKTDDMLRYEYARSALMLGLRFEQRLSANPFQFGMIGASDSHTSLSAVEEESFFGKHAASEPSARRALRTFRETEHARVMGWQEVSSGFAGVWATANTREAIWDAMKRREVYASTGPRMVVRFFGGWDFVPTDAGSRTPADVGYAKGVPMGAELSRAPGTSAPTFLVAALRDPVGANLDRIQIVKGWLDEDGGLHERVHDVAWSDAATRRPDESGRLPAVGSTVDLERATWTDTIGAPTLTAVWSDPDFDPAQQSFYYARVLEIPTPRWTAYDAARFGTRMPTGIPLTLQERAYTSPIWYVPE